MGRLLPTNLITEPERANHAAAIPRRESRRGARASADRSRRDHRLLDAGMAPSAFYANLPLSVRKLYTA